MITAEYDFPLPVAPGAAFDYVADPRNDQEWQGSCEASTLLGATLVTLGCRYAIVFRFLGRRMEFVGQVTELDRPESFAFRVEQGPFHYDGHYRFAAEDGGTRVHWRFNAEPGGFFGLVPATLLRKVLVSQVEKDSQRLRAILAARPGAVLAA